MSETTSGVVAVGLVGLFCCGLIGSGFACGRDYMKDQAVEKGHAEFNQKTGEWQWKPTPAQDDGMKP